MRDRRTMLLGAMLLLSIALLAQQRDREPRRPDPVNKEPWEWSVEERIASRTDRALARERVRDDEARQQKPGLTTNAMRAPLADSLNGRTPELFLPHEVFRSLIEIAYLSSPRARQAAEKGFQAELKSHGLPDDFWRRLEVISASYISSVRELDRMSSALAHQQGFAHQQTEKESLAQLKTVCRTRAAALAEARKEFGREAFDRFLYEAVAPGKFWVTDRLPTAQELRDAEEGCR